MSVYCAFSYQYSQFLYIICIFYIIIVFAQWFTLLLDIYMHLHVQHLVITSLPAHHRAHGITSAILTLSPKLDDEERTRQRQGQWCKSLNQN